MSEYSYAPRRHREREPEYVTETTYIERGGRGAAPAPVRDLVYRPAREDSIEDIPRDFPPPGTEYRQTRYREEYAPRRTRSVNRGYDDDYYEDRRRRDRSGLFRIFEKLIGMDLKLRQYEQGKKFCDAVAKAGGIATLNRVWEEPAQMPTLAELDDPQGWMARTGPARAA